MEIAERIRELCRKNKISVKALERELGFGNGSITKDTTNSIRSDRLSMIADYFGVSMEYLMGKEEHAPGGSYVSSDSSSENITFFTSIDDLKIAVEKASFLEDSQKQRLMMYAQMLYDTQLLEKENGGEANGN